MIAFLLYLIFSLLSILFPKILFLLYYDILLLGKAGPLNDAQAGGIRDAAALLNVFHSGRFYRTGGIDDLSALNPP
jgi:hypothetical protein